MKVLVANLGSTSLKWRLFDFSNGQERLVHKGGFERVADYPKAIDDCLLQLKDARHIQSESDLAAVGFKTIMARGVNGCVFPRRKRRERDGSLQRHRPGAQSSVYHRHPAFRSANAGRPAGRAL